MRNLPHLFHKCTKDFFITFERDYPFKISSNSDEDSLEAGSRWLLRSVFNGKGGSSSYSLLSGRWRPPFPETTGYIIPTLFDCYDYFGDINYFYQIPFQILQFLFFLLLKS